MEQVLAIATTSSIFLYLALVVRRWAELHNVASISARSALAIVVLRVVV